MNDSLQSDGDAIFRALQAKATASFGGNTQGLLVVYATESFLRRLAISSYADRLILKGGVLMTANDIRQMTKDGELSARGLANGPSSVAATVAEILRLEPSLPDGILFDADSVRAEVMREGADYHGVRCKTTGRLGRAVIPMALDISFGELGEFETISIESVAEHPSIPVNAYPLTLNLAEKAVTAMQRGGANTRDRDFADLWAASRLHEIDAATFRRHLMEVAELRKQPLEPLRSVVAELPDRQQSYTAMVARMSYLTPPPDRWVDVLKDVVEFLDPLIDDADSRLIAWSSIDRRWSETEEPRA